MQLIAYNMSGMTNSVRDFGQTRNEAGFFRLHFNPGQTKRLAYVATSTVGVIAY